jgi:hypothetical protein
MFTQNANSASLFRNKDKVAGDKKPDYDGTIAFVCPDCGKTTTRRLSAWINTAKSGAKYMSLLFKPRDGGSAHTSEGEHSNHDVVVVEEDSDLPF